MCVVFGMQVWAVPSGVFADKGASCERQTSYIKTCSVCVCVCVWECVCACPLPTPPSLGGKGHLCYGSLLTGWQCQNVLSVMKVKTSPWV